MFRRRDASLNAVAYRWKVESHALKPTVASTYNLNSYASERPLCNTTPHYLMLPSSLFVCVRRL